MLIQKRLCKCIAHNFKYVPNTFKNNGVKLFIMYLELNYKKNLTDDA